jgi:hypothetical protein
MFLILMIFLSSLAPALAAGSSPSFTGDSSSSGKGSFTERAERRESKRWTLQEWLAQKDRNSMMDAWLSMNAPSPYELMLGGSYNSFQTDITNTTATKHTTYAGSFSAYAQFVGLTAEYENNTDEGFNDSAGLFNLRLIGHTIQGSYLTLHYGQRTRNIDLNSVRLTQQFGQASLQLYLIKNFGFDGLYRSYLPTSETTLGDVTGNTTEGGAFIDYKNFRVFGTWYKELLMYKKSGTETDTTRSGIRSGVKIFF